jgi:hypothetical protein
MQLAQPQQFFPAIARQTVREDKKALGTKPHDEPSQPERHPQR